MNKKAILIPLIILLVFGAVVTFYYANKIVSGGKDGHNQTTTQTRIATGQQTKDSGSQQSATAAKGVQQNSGQATTGQTASTNKSASTGNGKVSGTGTATQHNNNTVIYIKVIGKGGSRLFGPAGVNFPPGSKPDAITALRATGLSSTVGGGYVSSIQGEQCGGEYGWKYAINGTAPNVGAGQSTLNNGDKLIWWYGDIGSQPPAW